LGLASTKHYKNALSAGFVASHMGTYSLFLVDDEVEVLEDAIVLLNRMLTYESGMLCSHKPTKLSVLSLLIKPECSKYYKLSIDNFKYNPFRSEKFFFSVNEIVPSLL